MKYIQKFNESKQDIPNEIWQKIDDLHNRLIYVSKKYVASHLSKIIDLDEENTVLNNHCQFKIDIPDSVDFYDFINDFITDNKKSYDVEYDFPYLTFKDENFEYKVPLNLHAGYTKGQENDEHVSYMKYNIWINKNVIQKISK